MALKTALRRDLAGEQKAIRDYGQRQQQTKGALKRSLHEIQGDEKDHARILKRAIKRKKIGDLYAKKES